MQWMMQLVLAVVLAMVPPLSLGHGADHDARKGVQPKKEQKAWGVAGESKLARRTIEVTMSDNMRFTPDRIEVTHGETVKFVLRNQGKILHEYVIGTKKELDEHAALMVRFPNMEHDEPYMAHVAPGQSGEIVWKFNRAGDFDFACLIAGHYQAGMIGKIKVAAAGTKADVGPGRRK